MSCCKGQEKTCRIGPRSRSGDKYSFTAFSLYLQIRARTTILNHRLERLFTRGNNQHVDDDR